MRFFGSKDVKIKKVNEKDKNKQITGDSYRIRIYRLTGNVPSEISVFMAGIEKDRYKNSIIISEDDGFKEEFPSIVDSLVSDLLSKLESYDINMADQIIKIKLNIKKKEEILSKTKNGKLEVTHKSDGKTENVIINIETEKANLRLLKVALYSLENKEKNGSYEKIEQDGVKCLSYLISDGDLLPYWCNTPTINNEPVSLTPDMSLRKKHFYDNEQERLDDLKDMIDTPINRILKVIMLALIIIVALGNIGWATYNASWSMDLRDESLGPQLDQLRLDIVKAEQKCGGQLANQIENYGIIIDWATLKLNDEIRNAEKLKNNDVNSGNNIKI